MLFQAERIAGHLAVLPEMLAPRAVTSMRTTAFRLVSNIKLFDPAVLARDPRLAREFFAGAKGILAELNDRLTQIYFSHADLPEAERGK
jgi:hypothetical protein